MDLCAELGGCHVPDPNPKAGSASSGDARTGEAVPTSRGHADLIWHSVGHTPEGCMLWRIRAPHVC